MMNKVSYTLYGKFSHQTIMVCEDDYVILMRHDILMDFYELFQAELDFYPSTYRRNKLQPLIDSINEHMFDAMGVKCRRELIKVKWRLLTQ